MRLIRIGIELALEAVVIALTIGGIIVLTAVAIDVRKNPRFDSHTVKGFNASNASRVLAD